MVRGNMISILLPNRCEENVHDVINVLEKIIPDCEIIIAVDRYGYGKGWAIREALKHSRGSVIAFLDADGEIPPRMLLRLIPFLDDYDIVCGEKDISGLYTRRIVTYFSRIFIRILFGLKFSTQTGIKLFKREALPEWENNSWAFDIEILAKAHKNGKKIIGVPIDAKILRPVSPKAIWKTLVDSIIIYWRLRNDK